MEKKETLVDYLSGQEGYYQKDGEPGEDIIKYLIRPDGSTAAELRHVEIDGEMREKWRTYPLQKEMAAYTLGSGRGLPSRDGGAKTNTETPPHRPYRLERFFSEPKKG